MKARGQGSGDHKVHDGDKSEKNKHSLREYKKTV